MDVLSVGPADRRRHCLMKVAARITVPGLTLIVGPSGFGDYLQVTSQLPDVKTGTLSQQNGRKWYISEHATLSEIVQTVFKAALTYQEHELREGFTFDGVAVFGPHYDVERLAQMIAGRVITEDARA